MYDNATIDLRTNYAEGSVANSEKASTLAYAISEREADIRTEAKVCYPFDGTITADGSLNACKTQRNTVESGGIELEVVLCSHDDGVATHQNEVNDDRGGVNDTQKRCSSIDADADGIASAQAGGNQLSVGAAIVPFNTLATQVEVIPNRITSTVGELEYALTCLCLCYKMHNLKMHNLNVDKRYDAIKNIAEIKSRKEIISLHKKIIKYKSGFDDEEATEGKKLFDKISKLNQSAVLLACESVVSDSVKRGEFSTHHFSHCVKGWGNIKVQVLVHTDPAPNRFGLFTSESYITLMELYPFCKRDGKFYAPDAVTSVLTDVVLYCFKDVAPDLCISSSGGKSILVDLLDLTKLGLDPTKAIFVDSCARTAVFPMNTHRAFSKLYLNDADKRFYHFLSDMKEHPLHMITGILMLEYDKELMKLRAEAQEQKIKYDRLTTREDDLLNELKQSPDNSKELKEELKKLGKEWREIRKNSKLVAIRELMERRCNRYPTSTKSRIMASANLFWWVQMSFCGSFESGIAAGRLKPNLSGSRIGGMLSASLVLQKATITCMDCLIFAKQYMEIEQCYQLNDPPYAAVLGSTDKTYKVRKPDDSKPTGFEDSSKIRYIPDLKPFGIDKIDKLLTLMTKSKCISMLTHSDNFEVKGDCWTAGLYYLFEYKSSFGKNPYVTKIWGNNIKLNDILKHNKDGSVKSPAYIDKALYARYKARADKVQQRKAQPTNNSAAANKTPAPAISSDEEV